MNNNKLSLLLVYFRQMYELGLPDPIFSPGFDTKVLLQKLGFGTQNSAPQGRTVTEATTAVREYQAQTSMLRGTAQKQGLAQPQVSQTDVLARLSKLKPVDKIFNNAITDVAAKPDGSRSPGAAKESQKRALLREYYYKVKNCKECRLAATRRSMVFGAGNAEAPLMIIGEAPGADEDEQGLPFVGRAGQMLTDMLNAISIDRKKDIFLTNVLKCRPPDNRNPESGETVACAPILVTQIEIIKPKVLLLLGRIAAHAVLGKAESISKLRSGQHSYNGIPVFVTYHPAALLRSPEYKRPAWEDLQKLQAFLKELGVYGATD